jgi:multimeric flavodoxin WrbA
MFTSSDHFKKTLEHLKLKKNILFLTTSNRWSGEDGGEKAKSTQLALHFADLLGSSVKVMDIPKLKIFPCEGNVSTANGNTCGFLKAKLNDSDKNPSGNHRCWASLNNPDDELWKVSKALFESDCVVFFGSVRWGQMNSYYQKLIERLTWIENRHSTLGEENVVKDIEAGIIIVGQNWHGKEVLQTQKDVLKFYGFNVEDSLCWNWQYSNDSADESNESYKAATLEFEKLLK